MPIFYEMTQKEFEKLKVSQDMVINYATKMEVAILGLLWCTGSQKSKANFLYKMLCPSINI